VLTNPNGQNMHHRPPAWKWTVCGLLLLATMLNYMDRQTLAQLATTIRAEYGLGPDHYGNLEMGFGLAFAAGALAFGWLVDKIGARWLYPLVLIGWSAAGIATAYGAEIGAFLLSLAGSSTAADEGEAAYAGLMACRVTLGFFEAGHWPCALVTTQTILARKDRSFGNSILQSGAAIGAIITPIIIIGMLPPEVEGEPLPPGVWRAPFVVIGAIGMLWVVPWLALVRSRDLERRTEPEGVESSSAAAEPAHDRPTMSFWRPFVVLVIIVITINLTWQFFRAWLPSFLEESRGYSKREVGWFTSAYYIATDAGCLGVGFLVKWLAGRGWTVHSARMATFLLCTMLTVLAVAAAYLPAGPLLIAVMLLVGAGALGLFPNFYSFTQELSQQHQGKIVGSLGTIAWISSALMQKSVGEYIKAEQTYAGAIIAAGLAPVLALLALWLLWPKTSRRGETDSA
jgi:MFS transporter, ACS family, hexuronate transporter